MLDLSKTTDAVKKELENDLYLLEVLKEDLVNIRALARVLLPKIQKKNPKASIDSISMAIKRYIKSLEKHSISNAVAGIITRTQLTTKNDVVHITYHRNDFVTKQLSKVSTKVNWDDEEIFLVNQGSGEVTVILDAKNESLLNECKDYKIESTHDLTIISLKEAIVKGKDKSIDVPGIYAYFIGQLARRSINLISVVSTYSQITLAFKSEDFSKAYTILQDSIRYFRNKN